MTWRLIGPIWRIENVTASQRLVLLALASFTDQNGGNAYPSLATLASMCCCNRSTVRRAIKSLIASRLIQPTGKGRKGTIRYKVNASMHPQGAHSAPARGGTTPHNPSNVIPGYSNPVDKGNSYNYANQPAIQVDRFSTTSPRDYDIRTGSGGAMATASAARSRKR
jgi:hypothetical protein|tara:strand:+ start:2250 stop:2747 length:498 start_codon:yes stop_codon:yes gene_type:complete